MVKEVRCKTMDRKPLDRQESLAIAGINTTLVAVLVACLSAYIAFVYNTVQQAEIRAIEEAEKINSIAFLVHQCPFRNVEQTEVFDKEKLIDMMSKVTFGLDDSSLPKDVDGRARKALGIMGALVGQYPFPVLYFKTQEGRFAARSEAEPVSFANLGEVRAWIDSMHKTTAVFTTEFIGIPGSLLNLLKEFAKSAQVSEMRDTVIQSPLLRPMVSRKLVPGFGTHVTSEALDPVIVYYDFLNRIEGTMITVKMTQNLVKRADALEKGYPSRCILKIALLLVVVAFVLGVVHPLAAANVKRAFAVWLPFLIYVVIGFLALRTVL